jgi:tetratricopeptide (TPR) repeat protein
LAAHEELLHYYKEEKNEAEAEQTARRLLEYFPEHVPALEELADMRGHQGDHAEALTLLQRALKVNPLDRSLRTRVGIAHLLKARTHAEASRFAEARAEYQLALSYREGKDESTALYKWAACEFKAGDSARAEELLQTALAESGSRLALAYEMLIEIIRLQLPSKLKSRFNKAFKEGLAETPTAVVAARLARIAAVHRLANVIYRGQKAHEKQVLTYVERCLPPRPRSAPGEQGGVEFAEDQLVSVATSLLDLKAFKVLRKFTALGRHRFPRNPHFYLLEAESYFAQGPYRLPAWKLQPLLSKAAKLIRELPADEKQKALLEKIEHFQQVFGISKFLLNPYNMGTLEELFGGMMGGCQDEFGDEFEDDYDDDRY